jgi:ABC-2 type transport system permease protein
MNLKRILALAHYDLTISLRLKWRYMEMIYFPITTLLLWGFFTIYAAQFALQAAFTILTVQIFWQFANVSEGSLSQQMMEDIWSRSFRDFFTSPLTSLDYIVSKIFLSIFRSLISLATLIVGASFLFGINLLADVPMFLPLTGLIFLTSIGVAIIASAIILRVGAEYGFLTWSVMSAILLFAAPFYPLSVFPPALQEIAKFFPYTWIFEFVKQFAYNKIISSEAFIYASISSIVYFVISFPFFQSQFARARKTGRLVKIW